MGSVKTGKIRKWEKEHSLAPTYASHNCGECRRFHAEFPGKGFLYKDYCVKWMKNRNSSERACRYFVLRKKSKKSGKTAKTESSKKPKKKRKKWFGEEEFERRWASMIEDKSVKESTL